MCLELVAGEYLQTSSGVIFELKSFGKSIRGSNGSGPWVGRSTAQMSGNPIEQVSIPGCL